MKSLKQLTSILVFSLFTISGFAQAGTWVTTDAGNQKLLKPAASLPAPQLSPGQYSLTTTFTSNNGQDGNMFNIIVGPNPVTINYFDINMYPGTDNVAVYFRSGSYVGFESSSTGWNFAGASSVTSLNDDVPSRLNVGNIQLQAYQTYGFFITTAYGSAIGLNYTNCLTSDSYTDGGLTVTAGIGMEGLFTTYTYSPRMWNGTIYYTASSAVPFPYWAIAVVFGLIATFAVLRYRRRKLA